ncbi:MAG: recombinase family protein [Patescibacteria group bacterium]|nr:recombinase family protein [Patescibacteria group bacterium]
MEKAVILARVSSKEQADEGYSLPAQIKLLKDYAKGRFEVQEPDVFEIKESASGKMVRITFNNMLKHIKDHKIKIILCEKIDRLTRNPKDALMMYDWLQEDESREIHFVKESFIVNKNTKAHENLVWDMKVAIARFYSNNLSEEVKKGRKEKLAQGWLPAMPKLGYKTVGEKGHRIHVPEETEAKHVRKMFDLYATGNYPLKRLMYVMYEAGFRTKNGYKVSMGNLQRLLTDPFYYGVIRWEGKIYPGKHEPLISKETFDKVQAILKGKATPKLSRHYYLFKGHFHCSNCGGLITWEKHKGKVYGHCNYRYYKNCEKKKWVDEKDVENELLGYFDRLEVKDKDVADWLLKTLRESHGEEIAYFETTLGQLNTELARYQRMLDRLYEDKLSEEISKEQYDAKFKEISAKKEKIAEAIAKHSKQGSEYFELANSVYELGQKGRLIYESADPEQKRELMKLVFGKLELNGEEVKAEYSKPFEHLATAVKTTNRFDLSSEIKVEGKIIHIFSELKLSLSNKRETLAFGEGLPIWLGRWDSNPRPIGYTYP